MALNSLLNVVGTAIGAADKPAVELLVALALARGAPGSTLVVGRSERIDSLSAARAAAAAAHVDDFDDTHLETVVHPAAALLGVAAVFAESAVTGADLLHALAWGLEVQLRVALAISPEHYDAGWHITGTVGPIGASVTAALLLGLSAERVGHAVGISTSMFLGHRCHFGTMTKSFHAGQASANGLLSATLAAHGVTSPLTALEGPSGYLSCLSSRYDPAKVGTALGDRWEMLSNTFKPYPCGIVSHPAIEAAEELSGAFRASLDDSARVLVRCNPLVIDLTGIRQPVDGLEARFSTRHGVAAALYSGTVGLPEYESEFVARPELAALRTRIELVPEDSMPRDAATVELVGPSGASLGLSHVDHARGSVAHPLSDADIDRKVTALVDARWPGRASHVIESVRSLPAANQCGAFARAICAGSAP